MTRFTEEFNKEFESFKQQVSQILDVMILTHEQRFQSHAWRPLTDIYETHSAVIVKMEIAGINSNELEISFVDHVLTIRGVRKDTEAKLNYHCLEIPYGEFQVRIFIPGTYIHEKIKTKYENGYLYIILTKSKKSSIYNKVNHLKVSKS